MPTWVALDGIEVEPDALRLGDETLSLDRTTAATAEMTWAGTGYRVRAWTFGERRRLLAAYLAADGDLDVAGLAAAALAMLVQPEPAGSAGREVLGLAALAWSASGGARVPTPLPDVDPATQAVRLAAATTWRPGDLDDALAADVDRWYAALPTPPVPAMPPDPSFRSFRLED